MGSVFKEITTYMVAAVVGWVIGGYWMGALIASGGM